MNKQVADLETQTKVQREKLNQNKYELLQSNKIAILNEENKYAKEKYDQLDKKKLDVKKKIEILEKEIVTYKQKYKIQNLEANNKSLLECNDYLKLNLKKANKNLKIKDEESKSFINEIKEIEQSDSVELLKEASFKIKQKYKGNNSSNETDE